MAVFLLAEPAFADTSRWVEAEGVATLTGSVTADEARRAALNQARANAIEQLGFSLTRDVAELSTLGGRRQFFSQTEKLTRGRIIEEEPPHFQADAIPGSRPGETPLLRYRVRLRAKVVLEDTGDRTFHVSLALNTQRLLAGTPLSMRITCSRDAEVMVFNLAADDRVYLLFPNAYKAKLPVGASRPLQLPELGDTFDITPETLPGHDQDLEMVKVVAFKEPVSLPVTDSKGAMEIADFGRWLVGIPAHLRAEATAEYRVISRQASPGTSP